MPPPVLNNQPQTKPIIPRAAYLSLALLLSINLFNYIDRFVLAALEPEIGEAFFPGHAYEANTMARTGSLATVFLFTYLLAAPILGYLADRMSRWVLIAISVAIWSVATAGSGWATTFAVLLLMRCIVGIGEAGYGPAAPTIISDLFPVERRGRVLSWFFMAIPVGSALGYVIGSIIGKYFGWRVAFFVVTPPGLLLAGLALFMTDPRKVLRPYANQGSPGCTSGAPIAYARILHDPNRSRIHQYLSLFKNRSYVLDTFGMAAMTFAIGGVSFWMPRYLCGDVAHGCRGLPDSAKATFGIITAAMGLLATLLGGLAGDWLRPRFSGSYFIVSAGGMFAACPFIVLMLVMPFPWAWIPLAGCVFFLFFNTGPSNTILANVTHPAIRASAFAVNIFIIHLLGDATAPVLLGEAAGRFGWNGAFVVVIAAMILAGILWLMGAPTLQRDTEAVEAMTAPEHGNEPRAGLAT
ncbi:MAG: MFS transporter [Phycisphaerae bacterium]|nr:MFS transporter [Phycisphaerae bacterium]